MKKNILIKISIILLIISSILVNIFSYFLSEKQDKNKRVVLDEETGEEINLIVNESDQDNEPVNKETKRETQLENKKDIKTKRITESEEIPFRIIRKHNISDAKTRVRQDGLNTIIKRTYEITYEDGVEVSRKLVDEKTQKGQDKIIETLIDFKEPVVEEVEVEDKDKPIYETRLVYNLVSEDGENLGTFLDLDQAQAKQIEFQNDGISTSINMTEDEIVVGYEKVLKEVIVEEGKEVWE